MPTAIDPRDLQMQYVAPWNTQCKHTDLVRVRLRAHPREVRTTNFRVKSTETDLEQEGTRDAACDRSSDWTPC